MKTKLFLAALAIPAFFAACSQDEFVNNDAVKEVTGTPLGANLVFNVNKGADANTRLTETGWEANDIVGMAWTSDNPGSDITLGNKAYANHPLYFTSGSAFQSKTMMYVGSYIAYYPYNEELKSIADLTFSVPAEQTYKDADDFFNKLVFASDVVNLNNEHAGNSTTPTITLKQLSNRLALDLQFKGKTAAMTDPIVVKSVKIIGNVTPETKPFATSVTIVGAKWIDSNTKEEGNEKSLKDLAGGNEYLTATVSADANALTVTPETPVTLAEEPADGSLSNNFVFFNILPCVVTANVASASIEVETNYGNITVQAEDIFQKNDADAFYKKEQQLDNLLKTYTLGVGNSKRLRVVVDMSNAELGSPISCKNVAEINEAINLWSKVQSNTNLTIDIVKTALKDEIITLTDLDLSSLPPSISGNLTLDNTKAGVPIVFAGTTKLGDVILAGDKKYTFAGTTTITGTVDITTTSQAVDIDNDATVTIDGGVVTYNVASSILTLTAETKDKAGAVLNLINAGEFNKAENGNNATVNVGVGATINVGNSESSGYVRSKDGGDNSGTINLYNGSQDGFTAGSGKKVAVVANAVAFEAAVKGGITDITIKDGTVNFGSFSLSEDGLNVIIAEGGAINLAKKEVTFATLTVAANTAISGTKGCRLTTSGILSISPNTTLTINQDVEVNATELGLPNLSTLNNAGTFKYKSASGVGGTVSGEGSTTQVADF